MSVNILHFEWKDLISPVVTVITVWIGARLTLSNDIRKETLKRNAQAGYETTGALSCVVRQLSETS